MPSLNELREKQKSNSPKPKRQHQTLNTTAKGEETSATTTTLFQHLKIEPELKPQAQIFTGWEAPGLADVPEPLGRTPSAAGSTRSFAEFKRAREARRNQAQQAPGAPPSAGGSRVSGLTASSVAAIHDELAANREAISTLTRAVQGLMEDMKASTKISKGK